MEVINSMVKYVARIHRRILQKDPKDPDNLNDMLTHLEPDILKCEVKWVLGSITTKLEVTELRLNYFKS